LIRERANLGDRGRIVVRTSGTESVVRIMVEAADVDEAHAVADRLERVLATRA
jgi:phosphoglucosamine mutase